MLGQNALLVAKHVLKSNKHIYISTCDALDLCRYEVRTGVACYGSGNANPAIPWKQNTNVTCCVHRVMEFISPVGARYSACSSSICEVC